jgi:hypothetical protein
MAFFIGLIRPVEIFIRCYMATKDKYKPFVLPSDFKELETYVQSHKTDLTERVISSIEFAIKKNLPMVEVFNFKNSDFVITISREAFRDNIQNVYNFYLQEEKYELCGRVKRVELLLDSTVKPKKPNEKK